MSDITKRRMDMVETVVHTSRFIFHNYDILLKIWLFFFVPTIFITQLVTKTFSIQEHPLLGLLPIVVNTLFYALGAGAIVDLVRSRTDGSEFSIGRTLKEAWYKLALTSYMLAGLLMLGQVLQIVDKKLAGITSLLYFFVSIFTVFMFQVIRMRGEWGINAFTRSSEIVMANKLMVFLYWVLNGILILGIAMLLKRFTGAINPNETPGLVAKSLYGIFQFVLVTVLYINLTECPKSKETKINLVKPVT